jgi:hypothetical protein
MARGNCAVAFLAVLASFGPREAVALWEAKAGGCSESLYYGVDASKAYSLSR